MDTRGPIQELTPAERPVLDAALRGLTVRGIAAELVLGETTVKTHLAHIYAKLGVRGRIELLAKMQGAQGTASPATEEPALGPSREVRALSIVGALRRFVLPGLLAVALVGLASVASLALQPADKPADLDRLLAADGVQAMELRGSTLVITTQWSSQTQIANVDPARVRQLAIYYSVPLSVSSAEGADSVGGPFALIGGAALLATLLALFLWRPPRGHRATST